MNPKLKEIFGLCKETEVVSRDLYRTFEKKSNAEQNKAFWKDFARDESLHIAYWVKLESLGKHTHIKNPFHDIDDTIIRLEKSLDDIRSIIRESGEITGQKEALRYAILIEMLLLHPAITILFRTLKKHAGGISPEDDYSLHIGKLKRHAENYFFEEEYHLHTLALDHIFYQSREIANHIERIENLEGLIPICAWCKKIRDQNKNWTSVESYISKHSASEFTHGICPDCADKW